MDYKKYLKTEHWKEFRKRVIENAGGKCCLCSKTKGLDVHHNNYKHLWCEKFHDVAVLCRRCHKKVHGLMREAPKVRVAEPIQTAVDRITERIERCKDPEKRKRLEGIRFVYESDLPPEDMAIRLSEL